MVIDNRGQGTVEYILLILVVATISFSLMRLPQFRQLFDSKDADNFFNQLHKEVEFNYRYALPLKRYDSQLNGRSRGAGSFHLNYYNNDSTDRGSRFFIPFEEVQ